MTNKEAKLEELSRTLATIAWDHSVVTPDDYIDLAQRMLSALVQFGESGQEEEREDDELVELWAVVMEAIVEIDHGRPMRARDILVSAYDDGLPCQRHPAALAPEKGNPQMADECVKACDRINAMDAEQMGVILDKPAPEKDEAKRCAWCGGVFASTADGYLTCGKCGKQINPEAYCDPSEIEINTPADDLYKDAPAQPAPSEEKPNPEFHIEDALKTIKYNDSVPNIRLYATVALESALKDLAALRSRLTEPKE